MSKNINHQPIASKHDRTPEEIACERLAERLAKAENDLRLVHTAIGEILHELDRGARLAKQQERLATTSVLDLRLADQDMSVRLANVLRQRMCNGRPDPIETI